MNLRKAAKMALEALENLQGGCTDSDDGTVEAITVWCPEIIDALREALAQPGNADPYKLVYELAARSKTTPEQEPVAYRTVNNVGAYVYHSADTLPNEYGLRGEALYLHPAPIPEGWQLVPVEPTPEMQTAGYSAMLEYGKREVHKIFAAMLAAAPKPEDV